jgi:hypothetical protein
MIRADCADYCGDGQSHTRTGIAVVLYDRIGLQRDEPDSGLDFESAWTSDGAFCVARPRLPDRVTLEALTRSCPARLAGRVGSACTEREGRKSSEVLLFNRS